MRAHAERREEQAPAQRRRVLIVEDDPDLRDALSDDLADSGAEVIEARDGAEALEQMREHHPDVVVFDLLMPGMDGWQFRIAQRRDPELSATPVVAMSASGTAAAKAVDADVYLAKPFRAGTLVQAIDDVLSARERREQVERAAHRERLAALGTLAGGLAHEINNPLTYILINLAAAEQIVPSLGGESARAKHLSTLLRQALEGAERIKHVVRSVRMLSHGEAALPAPLDVRTVVEGALAVVDHELRARATLVTDLGEAPWVMADEGQLGTVALNLLLNAVQAIPDGDPAHHQVRVITSTSDDGDAVVAIEDTGAGIPEHLLPRIFEPFFTTKPVGQGAGLGLSVARSIVTELGGHIEVASEVGRGTRVRVTLPAGKKSRPTTTVAD
ncbi:MAG TPA: ATP-binding protein [Kofleriaceae bacterium]|nr:ATP-binding protein [Kofleriaceae bacterium]